jgi:hypothetical protein
MNRNHWVLLLALVVGCEQVDGGNDSGAESSPPPTSSDSTADSEGDSQALQACRDTCDDLLFYDCVTADAHEVCYDACSNRGSQDIETFVACVDNTLPTCSECYENFVDADPPPDPTGDDPQPTCTEACQEFVDAGCELEFEVEATSCASFCEMLPSAAQQLLVECVEARDGCVLPDDCTDSSAGGG